MPRTQINGAQVGDGSIQRADLDVSTAGSAVVRRILPGTNVTLSSTGPDAGTGDVTINAPDNIAANANEILRNVAGVATGDAQFTYDDTTDAAKLSGVNAGSGLILTGLAGTTAATAAASGDARFFTKKFAGCVLPCFTDEFGFTSVIETNLSFNARSDLAYGQTNTTNLGTQSFPVLASTNRKTATRRYVMTSAATAVALASVRFNTLNFWRGNAANLGGFFILMRHSLDTLQTGMRGFFGLSDSIAAPTNVDPITSTALSKIGLAINASTGNWSFINNLAGAAPTVLALGAGFPVNITDEHELILFCAPNASGVNYQITNITTGAAPTTGTLTTNIPANTAFLERIEWLTNNTIAAAVAYSSSRVAARWNY